MLKCGDIRMFMEYEDEHEIKKHGSGEKAGALKLLSIRREYLPSHAELKIDGPIRDLQT